MSKNIKMTEDDTFRILARPPFEKVKDHVWYTDRSGCRQKQIVGLEYDRYLESIGWTHDEYFSELVRRRNMKQNIKRRI